MDGKSEVEGAASIEAVVPKQVDDSKDEYEDDESMDEDEDDDPILDFLMEDGQCQLYEKIQTKLKSLPEG